MDTIIPAHVPAERVRRFDFRNDARLRTDPWPVYDALNDVTFRRNDMVLYSAPQLGLDRRRYADPLTVEFRRSEKKSHLAFGPGLHLCEGHLLARIELRVMLEEVLPRLPNLRVKHGAALSYVLGGTMSLESLPLEWDAPGRVLRS